MAMNYKLRFDGVSSKGNFYTGQNFASGDSISFTFRGFTTPAVTDHVMFGDGLYGDDAIMFKDGTEFEFKVKVGGTLYPSGDSTATLYDGEEHDLIIERVGSTFNLKDDGTTICSMTATSTTMGLYDMCYDILGSGYTPCEISNLVVIDSEYPLTGAEFGGDTVTDTEEGNDLTLTDVAWGALSTWEWVGDFIHIYKDYQTQSDVVYERRKEGTRQRVVKGYSMSDASIKQAGQELDSVTAYNGTQATTMTTDDAGGVSVDCDEEDFATIHGCDFFYQRQKWVSFSNAQ